MDQVYITVLTVTIFFLDWFALHDILKGEKNLYFEYLFLFVSGIILFIIFLRSLVFRQTKIFIFFLFLLFFTTILLLSTKIAPVKKPLTILPTKQESIITPHMSLFKVTRVIDGDTIVLENGKTVRYIGVDTPETKHPKKEVQCYGQQAFEKNKQLVLNKMVRLEKDVSEIDKYGRLLRYTYVDNLFVNQELVKQGFALLATYPPDVKYVEIFRQAQQQAKDNNLGLWKSCSFPSINKKI